MKKIVLAVLIALVFTGCASSGKKMGIDMDINKVIRLYNLEVHIVGKRSQFDWAEARNPVSTICAYARKGKGLREIWIFGRRNEKGEIELLQSILGHELQHHLHWADPEIKSPDRQK